MAQGVEKRKDHYGRIVEKDIAMPEVGELPPVLADNPADWAGYGQQPSQQQQAQQVQQPEVAQEMEDAQDDTEQVFDDSSDEQEEVQEAPRPKNTSAQESFRVLRERAQREAERAERAEREKEELMRYVLSQQQQSNPQYPPKPQEQAEESYSDYDIAIEDDALAEGKQLKRLAEANKRLAREVREMKRDLTSKQSQTSDQIIESQLRQQYSDLDDVVNKSNLDQLKMEYPEIAETIRNSPNLKSQITTAYNVIKKFGIHKDRSLEMAKVNVNKNVNKPRPVSSLNPQQGESPLSKANAFANGLTPELKAQMVKEMAEARKRM